jgi:dynein assembly factor 1
MTAGVTYPRRRPKKEAEDELITMGSSEMSLARLRKILESDRRLYYHSFDLNDKLYIHFQGFRKLDNLDKFTGLRSLYAEANAFEKIEGLEACTQLRSLFIQQNCIKKIEGLENNLDLWSLNLSENWISCIENLDHLRTLNSLTITKNRIGHGGLRDVLGLKHTTIATLDLSDNHIQDPEIVPEVLAKMTELRVLYLKGNPVVRNIPNYRKTVIASLPDLKYLDDRPVFEEDRRYAEAFVAGGLEGEREMRRIIKKEKEDYHTKQMQAFQRMMAEGKERKREIAGMRAEDKYTDETDPVETWKQRQERFTREHPEYDYEEAGVWDKKTLRRHGKENSEAGCELQGNARGLRGDEGGEGRREEG